LAQSDATSTRPAEKLDPILAVFLFSSEAQSPLNDPTDASDILDSFIWLKGVCSFEEKAGSQNRIKSKTRLIIFSQTFAIYFGRGITQ